MCVYNGVGTLERSLRSVLRQEGCDFEVIVVDDGSTDGSGETLDQWAATDERLRILHQQNRGLTGALIRGCEAAGGQLIARQDVGDESLPGRLARQAGLLASSPHCVAVTCHTTMVGPGGEVLFTSEIGPERLNDSLRTVEPARLAGPSHHGSVMFRRDAYRQAGGYRPQFYFAQDLDLWTRLVERGEFAVVPEVLYRARLEPSSISAMQAPEQRVLRQLIAKALLARRSGGDETPWLDQAATVAKTAGDRVSRRLAAGNYFIGSCLRTRDPAAARSYFRAAVKHDVRHGRAWARLVECAIRGRLRTPAFHGKSAGDA